MKRSSLLLSALFVISSAAAPISAASYSQLLVFGDSLVDSGNAQIGAGLLNLPDPAPASAGYFQGRFSNGYNFADDISFSLFGTPATPFLAGGRNVAVGGADAAFKLGELSPSFPAQLNLYAQTLQPIPSDALVLVTFGGNDVRDVVTNLGPVDFTPTLNAMYAGISALANAGAKTIVVTGLPDIGALPVTRAFGSQAIDDAATARSLFLNSAFQSITATLAASTGANIQYFDLFGLEHKLVVDPTAFGLPSTLNTTSYCQAGGALAVLSGCTGYLYFDPIHPTAQIHGVVAGAILAQLAVPEPSVWAMMLGGMALVGGVMRRERRQGALPA